MAETGNICKHIAAKHNLTWARGGPTRVRCLRKKSPLAVRPFLYAPFPPSFNVVAEMCVECHPVAKQKSVFDGLCVPIA